MTQRGRRRLRRSSCGDARGEEAHADAQGGGGAQEGGGARGGGGGGGSPQVKTRVGARGGGRILQGGVVGVPRTYPGAPDRSRWSPSHSQMSQVLLIKNMLGKKKRER